MEAMFPSCHLCKPGAESCCQGAAEYAAEVIHSEGLKAERPEKAIPRVLGDGQDNPDDPGTDEDVLETSFSGHLAPLQEQPSEITPQEGALRVGWKKMTDMSHMEIDYEITRGIPLHRALRHSELWTSPHEVRCRNRAADVWKLSTKVSTLDIFISHTWKTKGRWKVLALVIQTGWLHGLLGWSLGLVVMLLLRALDIVDDPWDNVPIELAGKPFRISVTLWTVISAELSMIVGLCLAPYLPFKTKHCFLDIACIHQEQRELFERGLYGIGGCLAVAKELRVLYSPEYLSSLWCWFELVGFRKANPEGKLVFAPLFIERSTAFFLLIVWCIALFTNVVLVFAEREFRQGNSAWNGVWMYGTIFFLPGVFVVHTLRRNYREKARLIFDLKNFDIDKLTCASDFDRAFILSAIDAWYGSREAFTDFVRSDLRKELLGLLPSSPHLPSAYAALILSATTAWTVDFHLSMYKAGAVGHDFLRLVVCFFPYFVNWSWFGANAVLYLSDRTASFGRNQLLDWCKTLAVSGILLLWYVIGLGLCFTLARSTLPGGLVVIYVAFSMSLPLFILDVRNCNRCCRKWWATADHRESRSIDLKNFDIDKLTCASDFDRAFILSAIDAWYGSREAFMDFVRSDLREELLGLLPSSPHLPSAYAALILSSILARIVVR